MQYSTLSEVSTSVRSINADLAISSKPCITLALPPLLSLKSAGACWHTLFSHGVIAKGFSAAPRKEGKGLEISFADMAMLGKSISFVKYDGGLVVEGLRSLLIPVTELPEDGTLQWHLEHKIKQNEP
jgi:hypothetical protein